MKLCSVFTSLGRPVNTKQCCKLAVLNTVPVAFQPISMGFVLITMDRGHLEKSCVCRGSQVTC